MKKQGTGLRYSSLKHIKQKYYKNYERIVKGIYLYKEYKNFKGYPKLNKKYKKSIKKYWNQYHVRVGLKEFEFYNFIGAKEDVRYITKRVYHSIIEPKLNSIIDAEVLSNKNYLDLVLKDANLPETVLRNIDGTLLDGNYNLITKDEANNILLNNDEVIYKPAIDSCGGKNIIFINKENINNINEIIDNKNFIIQKVIVQHEKLSKFNKTSVNTVRVLSFLHKENVHILYMVLRSGKEGSRLDNASAGGIQAVIKEDGYFSDYIVTIDNKRIQDETILEKYTGAKMPFYDEIVNEVKRLHPHIASCKLVGWDIAIDNLGKPTIIEINLEDIGMTDKSQCVNGPLFGEMTDEVLNDILVHKSELNTDN